MTQLGAIVRLIMLAACLVPFTNIRQVGAVLAFKPALPVQTAPQPQEDDSEREEEVSKLRVSNLRLEKQLPDDQLLYTLPPILSLGPPAGWATCSAPSPLDPFRNGLGSPYRC